MEHFQFNCQTSDGLQLHFEGWQPDGETRAVVCLVHGLGEHCGRYAHVGAAMAQAGYALMGADLRGHGRSGGQRGHTPSYDALMDDIGLLLEEADGRYPGLPRFLYGHSLGGNLVLNYALRRRPAILGVVASGPALRLAFDPPAVKLAIGRALDRIWPTFTQPNGLDRSGLSHDPQVVRAYGSDPLVHDRITGRLALGMLTAGQWALDHASEFQLPLLIFHGGADRLTAPSGSQEFAGKVATDCTLKLWDGLYHETHNELQKDEVLAFTIGWLDEHCPASPAERLPAAAAN
jgi:alpha-beta hydrolase superfamily lysophospholipase